jgi:murein DD-endopeptidase MepM/ murein hydrolase activator NlpD
MAKGNAKKGVAVFMILIMTVSLLLGSILILGLLNYAYANKIANIRSDLKIAILNDNAGTEVLALLSDRIEGYRHTEKIGSYLAEGMEDNSGYIAPFKQTLDTAFKKYDFAVSGTNVNFRNGVPQDLQDLTKPAIANCETAPGQDTVSDRISLVWPSESKDISSGFGGRDPSSNGVCSCHPGIDISGGGKRVLAAADGQIVFAGPSGGYGNMVIIEHKFNGKAYYTYYAHLDTIINSSGSVKAGEQIALSGNT